MSGVHAVFKTPDDGSGNVRLGRRFAMGRIAPLLLAVQLDKCPIMRSGLLTAITTAWPSDAGATP